MTRASLSLLPLLLLFCAFFPAIAATQSARIETSNSLDHLTKQHQRILDQLNTPDDGKIMHLDDPRVPGLLKQGWQIAGEWAAAYFNAHPEPTKSELTNIFAGFAPPPNATKSQYGDFL